MTTKADAAATVKTSVLNAILDLGGGRKGAALDAQEITNAITLLVSNPCVRWAFHQLSAVPVEDSPPPYADVPATITGFCLDYAVDRVQEILLPPRAPVLGISAMPGAHYDTLVLWVALQSHSAPVVSRRFRVLSVGAEVPPGAVYLGNLDRDQHTVDWPDGIQRRTRALLFVYELM